MISNNTKFTHPKQLGGKLLSYLILFVWGFSSIGLTIVPKSGFEKGTKSTVEVSLERDAFSKNHLPTTPPPGEQQSLEDWEDAEDDFIPYLIASNAEVTDATRLLVRSRKPFAPRKNQLPLFVLHHSWRFHLV